MKWKRKPTTKEQEALLKVGELMDEDKDYEIGTQEAYEEFVKKRNYHYTDNPINFPKESNEVET